MLVLDVSMQMQVLLHLELLQPLIPHAAHHHGDSNFQTSLHHMQLYVPPGELENIIVSEVSQVQKAKSTCFLSYIEYKANTNTSNIMKNRSH
jgi:hypothetical protein